MYYEQIFFKVFYIYNMPLIFFREQLKIYNQFSPYFDEIINRKINYKSLSDIEQDIYPYMVINKFFYITNISILIP